MKISDTPFLKQPPFPYFTNFIFLWEKSERPLFEKILRAQTLPPPLITPFYKGVPIMNYGSKTWRHHYLKGQEPIQTCKEILQYEIAVHLMNVCSMCITRIPYQLY